MIRNGSSPPMRFDTHRILPYAADDLYGIVADVESYPKFVPFLTEATILRRTADGFEARLGIGLGFLRERFTSRVTLDPGNRRIAFRYVDGPLRSLKGEWRFQPCDNATEGGVRVAWAFASGRLDRVAQRLFDAVSARMIQAFERRAKRLHRRGAIRSSGTLATGEQA
jgi:coenzyme Q-binding protein COQ10